MLLLCYSDRRSEVEEVRNGRVSSTVLPTLGFLTPPVLSKCALDALTKSVTDHEPNWLATGVI